ncbi:MAG: hypothetical protein ACI8WB_004251 [Phenylobacterium sp.]|jgi:hypothetical protein
MLKKTIGLILLFHPIFITILLLINNVEFFWYWYNNFPVYDFIYACLSLVLFFVGLFLVFKKHRLTMAIFVISVFVVYQTFSTQNSFRRFDARIELPEQRGVALVSHGGGAFIASGAFTHLLVTEPKYWLFTQDIVIKTYLEAGFGQLKLDADGTLYINLETYNKEKISESMTIDALIALAAQTDGR